MRSFLGVAYDGSGWAAFGDWGQTFRSADGIRWEESGRLPEDADYLDIAPGAEPGRFTFVGMKGRIGEYVLGSWGDALTPAVQWIVPGEPDLTARSQQAVTSMLAVPRARLFVGKAVRRVPRWR